MVLLLFLFVLTVSSVNCRITGIHSRSLTAGDAEPVLPPGLNIFMLRFCPHGKAAFIIASKKNLTVNSVNIDITNKPKWFAGGVILRHNEKNVSKALNIIDYLEDVYQQNPILPKDPVLREEEKAYAWKLITKARHTLDKVIEGHKNRFQSSTYMHETMQDLEKELIGKHYLTGSAPAYTDYVVFPFVEKLWILSHLSGYAKLSLTRFPDEEKYKNVTQWFERMQKLPEVLEATLPFEYSLQFWDLYLKEEPNYNIGVE